MTRPYLDFYEAHKIAPVRQDLSNMDRHFARRRALYRHLGLLPNMIRGRRVLEIGPGSGDNALYTAHLAPALYVMVDANTQSIANLYDKQAAGLFGATPVEIRQVNLLDMVDDSAYDVVLCEGLLPPQSDPVSFLNRIAALAAADGVLVVTTMSCTSLLAETCRRALRPIFERKRQDLSALTADLVAFFQPDLLSLPGMSRLHEDWVMDQIIHPYTKNVAFTLEDAARVLGPAFDVVGTSPRLLQDWRWYKAVPESPEPETRRIQDQLAGWSLAMIDYRLIPSAATPELGRKIEDLSREAWSQHVDLLEFSDDAHFDAFLATIRTIRDLLPAPWALTQESLDAFLTDAPLLWRGKPADLAKFRTFFGRGQQYLMAVRNAS